MLQILRFKTFKLNCVKIDYLKCTRKHCERLKE